MSERFSSRWSTPALLGFGVVCILFRLVLGARFRPGGFPAAERMPRPADATETSDAVLPSRVPPENPGQTPASRLATAEAAWQRWASQPGSLERDEQMERALETLAKIAPARALSLALAQPNLALRQRLLSAALHGWAGVAPEAAADWSLQRPFAERGTDVAAVFAGA